MRIEAGDPDPDDGRYCFCAACEINVQPVRMDLGIGTYEYWGARGVHHDWHDACPNCGGDLSEPQRDDEFESED